MSLQGVARPVITLDHRRVCVECSESGALPSGLCLECAAALLAGEEMKSLAARELAVRYRTYRPQRPKSERRRSSW